MIKFTDNEAEALDGYFKDMSFSFGNIPHKHIIEAVGFKDEDGIGGLPAGGVYKEYKKKFGMPSLDWEAREYAEFQDWKANGPWEKALRSAFKKLEKAGLMSCDSKTGTVTIDTKRITIEKSEFMPDDGVACIDKISIISFED